ncbi:MAG: DUF5063 domain-containing protein [Gammaproteobacteria bacterium]|nr:DUF5063 domain-containing protein [Gammaproteobacteria bacterium]
MPLQCARMASVAGQYCAFIEDLDGRGRGRGAGLPAQWLRRLEKLLPRLHVAVIALLGPVEDPHHYRLHDDDQRCELFLRLTTILQSDRHLWANYQANYQTSWQTGGARQASPQELCERMADNMTDMYFDLRQGLELVREKPLLAAAEWQRSFYVHWARHLLDAECWLYAVDAGGEPPQLPAWRWPDRVVSRV